MEFTSVFPADRIFAEPVVIGTSLPTIRVATSLSTTTTDGFDSTLVAVTACNASSTTFGRFSLPTMKLKPGNPRLRAAPTTLCALNNSDDEVDDTPGPTVGMLDVLPITP